MPRTSSPGFSDRAHWTVWALVCECGGWGPRWGVSKNSILRGYMEEGDLGLGF